MPNIAGMFKQEIIRLARRELRAQTKPLHKTSTQTRRAIAELKRHVARLQGELKRFLRIQSKTVPTSIPEPEEGKGIRFTAKGVIAHRKRLGLSAADYGKLVGVTGHSVYGWEQGRTKPHKAQVMALGAIRGMGKREAMEMLKQAGGEKVAKRERKAG